MSEKGYNGWSNYETWCVSLWLSNEEPSYRWCVAAAREAWEEAEEAEPLFKGEERGERAARMLADTLKDHVEEQAPELGSSLFSDLLTSALAGVDWLEIAEAHVSDYAAPGHTRA